MPKNLEEEKKGEDFSQAAGQEGKDLPQGTQGEGEDLCQAMTEDQVESLADFFKMFSDSTRLRILIALSQTERNVLSLAAELSMSQSAISHQLRLLKQLRLVKGRRDGIYIFYSLDDEHVSSILRKGIQHVLELE